ncbi:DUF4365 domain-containing protein [Planomonospora parontospora]|uniref:DUF4365 domain-containing protein n=1 Tax=Planomonospora parontospora TaxID=58119 RepID=UPI0016704E25|nr:DUF4365 domain-containing protein [Planomonospora parontospora]GGL51532.1 hypothetical protein GCM10014719_61030 [Planomonospora parontospora subsp. antibiotica]GII20211.1 hypothetical protein Ppa05_69370 [Planomonospora parontospora subsp. antibiotica]
MPDPLLPRRDSKHKTGKRGVVAVHHAVLNELNWVFREQSDEDYGIDAHIEIVAQGDQHELVTGQLIGAQIKGGPTQIRAATDREGWYFYSTKLRQLNYWLGHSLPIIVIVYDQDTAACYWQAVTNATVQRTKKGFKIFIPKAQRLGASSREALEDLARRRGQHALEAYDRSLSLLPEGACAALRHAHAVDPTAAARVAQLLADGRAQPGMIASQLLGAQPTWLVDSDAVAWLWSAIALYADAHLHHEVAARLFLQAAACGGEYADRRRAVAGLAFYRADLREEARLHLQAVTAANARMLADVGLAALSVPPGDARPLPEPESITTASQAQIREEPVVANFLAENRLRGGDYDSAIALLESVQESSAGRDAQIRLRLAEMLRRRMHARGGFGGPDSHTARAHARAALEELRRWAGPSFLALSELLDLEILDGVAQEAVTMALPAAAGGTALDAEAAQPEIARKGATAALMSRDERALAHFRQILADDVGLALLNAQQQDLADLSLPERQELWRGALQATDDDRSRAIIAARLTELGIWPIAELEELRQRSAIPTWMYRMLAAKARAAHGQVEEAIREMRILAEEYAGAALELVRLLDQVSDASAMEECQRQYQRWHDGMLLAVMPHLNPAGTDVEPLFTRLLGDRRLPRDARGSMRRRLVAMATARGAWPQVVQLCEAGLVEHPDDDLAWQLIAACLHLHDMPKARATLVRYRLIPRDENTARLWARLHLGADLSIEAAELAVDLAERYGPALAEPLGVMLLREMNRSHTEQQPWPQALIDRVHTLVATAQASGYGPELVDHAELVLRLEQHDYDVLEQLRQQAHAGKIPLSQLAARAARPYGQALLQRAAGVIVAADPELGLNTAGQDAARTVLASGRAVADLSALLLLQFLNDHGRDLRARLPHLIISSSTADDAIRTRDAIWAVTGASFTAHLHDGALHQDTLSAHERAWLRELAARLEEVTARLSHQEAGTGRTPAADALALAAGRGIALYADDVALRQLARGRGIATFGTGDLIAALGDPPASPAHLQLLLAEQYVVDLPLSAEQIIELHRRAEWQVGPGTAALARPQWWQHLGASWPAAWQAIATAAAQHAAGTLITLTQTALRGSLQHVPAGERSRRYLEVTVAALKAAHHTGQSVPPDVLDQFADGFNNAIPPAPKIIFHALRAALHQHGTADPAAAAACLLPSVYDDPATWTT